MHIGIPLAIENGSLKKEDKLKLSIDTFLDMLLRTPQHSAVADSDFGYVFNNLRFEIFDEYEGVVYDSNPNAVHNGSDVNDIYNKKVAGTSRNINTFASELKAIITKYETRLTNISVSMNYFQAIHNIEVTIQGTIAESQQEYTYQTSIKIWN